MDPAVDVALTKRLIQRLRFLHGRESIVSVQRVLVIGLLIAIFMTQSGSVFGGILLNRSVEVQNSYQGSPAIGPNLVTVVTEIEFPDWGGNRHHRLDILDDGFIYTSLRSAQRGSTPNLLQVSDVFNVVGRITSIQIVSASASLNDSSRLYFDSDSFWYDVGGIYTNQGDYVQVRITVSDTDPVPEPSSVLIMGFGLSGYLLVRRGYTNRT